MARVRQACNRVFLIEQDSSTRSALREFFEKRNFALQEMGSALEALHFLQEHKTPAVIVLDCRLADISIAELTRELSLDPRLAEVALVLLYARDSFVEHEFPRAETLCRPVDPAAVFTAIKKLTVTPRPEILLVEDDRGVREFLQVALQKGGFTVRVAGNGQEGVGLFEKHAQTLAGVLMDVRMPDLDGPEAFRAMRKIRADIPCCFMSGNMGKYSSAELLAMGAARVILKPFLSIDHLTFAMWEAVDG